MSRPNRSLTGDRTLEHSYKHTKLPSLNAVITERIPTTVRELLATAQSFKTFSAENPLTSRTFDVDLLRKIK